LVAIWEQVLGVTPISVDANFFALGGHSLLATQVISHIQEHFGIELPIWTIFETLTVANLAQAVMAQAFEAADSDTLAEALQKLD
jgi:acyl carrier protein